MVPRKDKIIFVSCRCADIFNKLILFVISHFSISSHIQMLSLICFTPCSFPPKENLNYALHSWTDALK